MDSERLQTLWEKLNIEPFRYKQLRRAIFQEHISNFTSLSTLKKDIRAKLENQSILQFTVEKVFISKEKNCYKALLKLSDGNRIETVLMSPKTGLWTVCVSSQVGCALGCTFCATGTMGLIRHLTSEEITDQVLFWLQYIKEYKLNKLNNIVYMGMGEPLHNKQAIFNSLEALTNPDFFSFASRHISVSTSGLIPELKELANTFPQVNLAVSLHSATNESRQKLMPINNRYNLEDLHSTLEEITLNNKRKIFIEYILIQGENDSIQDALHLANYIRSFSLHYLFQINLIVYNQTESKHEQSSKHNVKNFKNRLIEHGLLVTIRKNLGRDIGGACGQLVYKTNQS